METPKSEFQRRVAQLNGLTPMATAHEERDPKSGARKWSVNPYFIVQSPSENIYVQHYKLYDSEREAISAGYWIALDGVEKHERGDLIVIDQ